MLPVKLGYKTISVEFIPNPMSELNGLFKGQEGKIYVDADLPPEETLNVIVHELLHAIYYTYGLTVPDEVEEKYVTILANGITETILRNPQLVATLAHIVQAVEEEDARTPACLQEG